MFNVKGGAFAPTLWSSRLPFRRYHLQPQSWKKNLLLNNQFKKLFLFYKLMNKSKNHNQWVEK